MFLPMLEGGGGDHDEQGVQRALGFSLQEDYIYMHKCSMARAIQLRLIEWVR